MTDPTDHSISATPLGDRSEPITPVGAESLPATGLPDSVGRRNQKIVAIGTVVVIVVIAILIAVL